MRHRGIYCILFIVCLCFLKGCHLSKYDSKHHVEEAANLAPSLDHALSTPDFTEGDWPADDYWTMFRDSQLNTLIEQALINNPSMKAAIARVESAKQVALSIHSKQLPKLGADFVDNYQHISREDLYRFPPSQVPAVVNQLKLALTFEYEFDFWGKNLNAYRAAIGEARSQLAEAAESTLMITTSLIEAYIDLQAKVASRNIQEDLLKERTKMLELITLRFDHGLEDMIAVESAKENLIEIEQNIVQLNAQITLDKSLIKILMGEGPDSGLEIEDPVTRFDQPFPLPDNLPVDLLARRPDLMAQIWKVEARAHKINVAKAAFYPNLNLKAFAALDSLKLRNFFSIHSFAGLLSPAIHLPVYTGGKLSANLLAGVAEYDVAVFEYNAMLLRAAKEVADRIVQIQSTNDREAMQSSRLDLVMNKYELQKLRYEKGIANYLSVLEFKENVMQENLMWIDLNQQRLQVILNLIKALGGGYLAPKVRPIKPLEKVSG